MEQFNCIVVYICWAAGQLAIVTKVVFSLFGSAPPHVFLVQTTTYFFYKIYIKKNIVN